MIFFLEKRKQTHLCGAKRKMSQYGERNQKGVKKRVRMIMFLYGSYLNNYIKRIKDTKKVAREKNIGIWFVPVIDSIIIILYASWEISIIIMYNEQDPNVGLFSFITLTCLAMLTILDRLILFFIRFHAYVNKLVLQGISKLDMYFWKKTGKDAVVTNSIWKLQGKYMKRTKKQKRMLTVMFVGLIMLYYGWLISV